MKTQATDQPEMDASNAENGAEMNGDGQKEADVADAANDQPEDVADGGYENEYYNHDDDVHIFNQFVMV
ncbi:unnamed protein product [Amoebophrya sp. A25]|nr:unnamed protein product [Amoebophrya sp. A25]|eukprot:GSA25T00003672001.1